METAPERLEGSVTFLGESYDYTYLRQREVVRFFKNPTLKNRLVGLDIETYARQQYVGNPLAGLIPEMSRIRLIQMFDGEKLVVLDMMMSNGAYYFLNAWIAEQVQKFLLSKNLVAHNAIFETSHLQRAIGAHRNHKVEPLDIKCTMMAAKLLAHASTPEVDKIRFDLASLIKMVFDEDISKSQQLSDWSVSELSKEQIDYAALDAILPYMLIKELAPRLDNHDMLDVFKLNIEAQEAVAQMRIQGVGIDVEEHNKLVKSWRPKLAAAKQNCLEILNNDRVAALTSLELRKILSAKVVAAYVEDVCSLCVSLKGKLDLSTLLSDMALLARLIEKETDTKRLRALKRVHKNIEEWLITPSSNKRFHSWLLDNLSDEDLKSWPVNEASGYFKKDADTLLLYDHLSISEALLEFSEFEKLYKTYGVGLQKFMLPYDESVCVVYPNFTLCHTGTGRMSSYDPNMQNMPRSKEIRKLFIPKDAEAKLLCADYSQIELRVLAEVSQDPVMLNAYATGKDLHRITAAQFARVDYDEVNKEQRQGAKAINFGIIYGAGPKTVQKQSKKSYGVDWDIDELTENIEEWRELYSGAREWQIETADAAEKSESVVTPYGKVRKLWPDGTYCASMNTIVQGGAAEVLLKALRLIWEALQASDIDAKLVNVVHDEIIVECEESRVEEAKKIIQSSMYEAMLYMFPDASTKELVEVGVGDNWAEAK